LLKGSGISIKECPVKPESLSELINLTSEGSITEQIAKSVLEDMFATGKSPSQIIKEKDIKVIQEEDILSQIVEEVISENQQIVEKIKGGKMQPVNFLVGQVMKKTRGQADAKLVREMILQKLNV